MTSALLILLVLFLIGCLTRWGYRSYGYTRSRLAGVGLLVWVILFPALSRAAGPTDQVRSTVDKVLAIVRSPKLKSPEQKKDFRARLAEIISPRFDFAEMAKRSLGPQWARRSPAEQREFVKLFTDLLGRSYADRIESYSSQKVVYTREVEDKEYAEVDTTVVSDKQEKVSINYKLRILDKEWRVYDLVIEDVSVVNNYRSQFNRVIAHSSFEELLRRLKEKQS
jgi:phospholipid transport system substrate-binding protein